MIPVVVHEFQKNVAELVRISLVEFKGKKYFSIWVFYDSSQTEIADWRPSRKGVCLPVHLLDELLEGVKKVMEATGVGDGQAEDTQGGEKPDRHDQGQLDGDTASIERGVVEDFRRSE
jgi:hypothetical protein